MTPLRQFRLVALLEGWSFVLLLFVAMPLKHYAGMPMATRVVGSVHGFLFVAFISSLYRVASEQEWSWKRSGAAFASSMVPFGTFVFDRTLQREMVATRA